MIKQLFLASVILGASLFITENCTAAEQWVYGGPVPTIEERAAINQVSVAEQRAAEEAAANVRRWVYGGPVPQRIEKRAAINGVSVAQQRVTEEAAAKYRNGDPMPESIAVRAAVNQVPISEQRKIEEALAQMKGEGKAKSKEVKTFKSTIDSRTSNPFWEQANADYKKWEEEEAKKKAKSK